MRTQPAKFGEKGRTSLAITNEELLPVQARGAVTQRLYVWRCQPSPVPWIDIRDLPSVIKELESAGVTLDDLDGEKIRERKKDLAAAERARKKEEREMKKQSNTTEEVE
jgi:hypothetical protein